MSKRRYPLVLTFRSGTRDEYNRVRPMALPGVFKEIAGIEAVEFDAPKTCKNMRRGKRKCGNMRWI